VTIWSATQGPFSMRSSTSQALNMPMAKVRVIAPTVGGGFGSKIFVYPEEVVVSWLRQMLGLPAEFDGMFTDTASVSSLLSIVAARHALPGLSARDLGLAGRPEIKPLRLYCSTEAHVSIDKAAIVAEGRLAQG